MSRFFGPIRQVGHVVRDVDRAMRYWTETLGVGPFYVIAEREILNFQYRGRPSVSPVITMAFAQSGNLEIELIQQHNDAPTAYREFLSSGREGVQHISPWFDTPSAYEAARATMIARGMEIVHETIAEDRSPRFVYFETGTPDAPLLELAEAMLPGVRTVHDTVAAASVDWDGSDPVRAFVF